MNAGAFDISVACTGFVYALEIAKNFILGGTFKNILIVATEVMSNVINWKDRNTCVLFGDGAGAVIVSKVDDNEQRGILCSIMKAEGDGADFLKIPTGGTKRPFKSSMTTEDTELYPGYIKAL